ncbi:MAG: hypothetical protein LBM77_07940 [Spirochaetaceae bacterium]|jgi:hypothetical protein|nr:hypothetical protein [Spirochaetaceae bacterium]
MFYGEWDQDMAIEVAKEEAAERARRETREETRRETRRKTREEDIKFFQNGGTVEEFMNRYGRKVAPRGKTGTRGTKAKKATAIQMA